LPIPWSGCGRITATNNRPMKQRDRLPLWVHSVAWGGLLILILLLVLVGDRYRGQGFWQAWVESHELSNPGYSERIHPNDLFPRQHLVQSGVCARRILLSCIGVSRSTAIRLGGRQLSDLHPCDESVVWRCLLLPRVR
jgi:hypothetical protein